jgi:hypothetical protein
MLNIGLIKWFNLEKGYGIIATNKILANNFEVSATQKIRDGVFLHIQNWLEPFAPINIQELIPVVFKVEIEKNRNTAKKCKYFTNTIENWKCIISCTGNSELITLEYSQNKHEINIIEYVLYSLTNTFSADILLEELNSTLKSNTSDEILIRFKTFLAVHKKTENIKLKELIESSICKYIRHANPAIKFDYWKEGVLANELLLNEDLLKLSIELTFQDLELLKNSFVSCEIINLILLRKLKIIEEKFDDIPFKSFDNYLQLIDIEAFKIKIINDLNRLAKSHYLDLINNKIRQINVTLPSDLSFIDGINESIPNFLNEEVRIDIHAYIENHISESQDYQIVIYACLNNYLANAEEKLFNIMSSFTNEDLKTIFLSKKQFSSDFKPKILKGLIDKSYLLSTILQIAKDSENNDLFIEIDNIIFNKYKNEYFSLWKNKIGNILPFDYLVSFFDDDQEKYNTLKEWVSESLISPEIVNSILISKLLLLKSIDNQTEFNTSYNIIKYLIGNSLDQIEPIKLLKNNIYDLLLWNFDVIEIFDFNVLKGKFIYFPPFDQVIILRKLFSLKVQGKFDLSLDKLNELSRIDSDLYKTNQELNYVKLDISTYLIIKVLTSYKLNGRFLLEHELLNLVLKNLIGDKKHRFKLSYYFEKCKGREIAEWDWNTSGKIKKIPFGDNRHYFAIEFEYDDILIEKVKAIPGRKWNDERQFWGVPAEYENEVLTFAKDNKFFIDFDGKSYTNNSHLAVLKRVEIPNGIKFCEGRLANKIDATLKREFWWCAGRSCYGKCETIHSFEEWRIYSLLDFCEILEINTDEVNSIGDFIPKGHYYQFIGLINRFNRLLDKIYCQSCDEILHPFETGHFAAHTIVRFCCVNNDCMEYQVPIYLNHCLNGQCNGIIDSRVSKKCSNGLFICDTCGSCCSHQMLKRRLDNLVVVGGYIHDNLRFAVSKKLGHLERAEYFCYKCAKLMVEKHTADIFECEDCNIVYNTTKYKFKRIHRNLRNEDILESNHKQTDEDYAE